MANIGQKRSSFETVSHNHLLTISFNKSIFFWVQNGSNQTQTIKNERNCELHLEHSFLQITRSRTLLCISNIQVLNTKVSKSHKQNVVPKKRFRLLGTRCCG